MSPIPIPVPLSLRLVAAALALLTLTGGGWLCYERGRLAGAEQERQRCAQKIEGIERSAREQAETNQRVITKTVTRFVTKAAQDQVIHREQIKEIEKYAPTDRLVLSGDFRVFHDAAARGVSIPDAGDPTRINAAPVAASDLAVTVAENYAGCREDRGRLEALQEIVRKIGNK